MIYKKNKHLIQRLRDYCEEITSRRKTTLNNFFSKKNLKMINIVLKNNQFFSTVDGFYLGLN